MPKIAAGATNKNISLAPNGTGKVVVGTGAADATVQSDGDHNLILQTGNSTTSKIEINDGANGDVAITPNGTGNLTIDNIAISDNAIISTDTNGNIDLTPNGTGEVNISKVDIDGGAIDATDVTVGSGKTLDVSAGTLTTSTAQKQAIVDGADIEGTDILSTGESGSTKFLRENGSSPASWEAVGSASLPSQTGNADKLLTTNGTAASWTNAPINLVKLAFAGQSSEPSAPSAGTVYYNTTTNVLKLWNGTAFIPLNELASGGIITSYTTGGTTYRLHTFVSSGTFTAFQTLSADVFVVAGGGSGGNYYAGGGGAGGLIWKTGYSLTANTYDLVVGAGGAAKTTTGVGNTGTNSTVTSSDGSVLLTALGGGGGGSEANDGVDGGSAGGGGYGTVGQGGSGTQPDDSGTGFGNDGGDGLAAPTYNTGGGGGAMSVGETAITARSGNGGTGKDMSSFFGTSVGDSGWFASGGGGGSISNDSKPAGSASSGGGSGGSTETTISSAGQANTGGASGGGSSYTTPYRASGAGGSGVLIIRYAI